MGLFKKKYNYEFLNPVNFGEFDPKSAEDLISIVESESFRLKASNKQGSVIAAKSLDNKTKDIFVAIKVNLPLSDDEDVDTLLIDLYSKKYVPFDERIFDGGEVYVKLAEDSVKKQIQAPDNKIETPETPEMPEEMKNLLAQSKGGSNAPISVENTPEQTGNTELEVMREMMKAQQEMMKSQDEKINRLTRKLEDREVEETPVSSETQPIAESVPESLVSTVVDDLVETKPDTEITSEETASGHSVEAKSATVDVRGIVKQTSSAISASLLEYVATEKTRIATEMRQLDKRHLIEPEVKARLEKQKHDTIKSLTQENDTQKSAAITEENTRHEAKLTEIDQHFATELKNDVKSATDQLAKQATQEIDSEYKKQTAQLDNILKGKTDELQMLQREVNEGLQNGLEEALKGFNTDHEQVIKDVESQRVGDNVVTMHA